MKHFLRINHNGEIIGSISTKGGFSDEHDMSDPNNNHPIVVAQRKLEEGQPDFARHLTYECPCPRETETCKCVHNYKKMAYVDDGVLVGKPVLTVLVDGEPATTNYDRGSVERTPRSTVKFKLAASVPDGHRVLLKSRGPSHILRQDVELVFTGGTTQEIDLTSPAHGMSGWVVGLSKYVRPFRLELRSWA